MTPQQKAFDAFWKTELLQIEEWSKGRDEETIDIMKMFANNAFFEGALYILKNKK